MRLLRRVSRQLPLGLDVFRFVFWVNLNDCKVYKFMAVDILSSFDILIDFQSICPFALYLQCGPLACRFVPPELSPLYPSVLGLICSLLPLVIGT